MSSKDSESLVSREGVLTSQKGTDGNKSKDGDKKKEESSGCCACFSCCSADPGLVGTRYSMFLLVVVSILSIILRSYGAKENSRPEWENGCESNDQDYEDTCKGYNAVYRITFASVIVFAIQALFACCSTTIYDACWIVKLICCALITVGFWFLPNSIFDDNGYAWFARIGGAVFIFLQQVILLDLAGRWNEKWSTLGVAQADNELTPLKLLLVVFGLGFFAIFIVVMVLLFSFFDTSSDCESNSTILSMTLILVIAGTFIQLFLTSGPTKTSLLTSGVLAVYSSYLCYSALSLNPAETCNPTLSSSSYRGLNIAIGIVFAMFSIVWMAVMTSRRIVSSLHNREQSLGVGRQLTNVLTGGSGTFAGRIVAAHRTENDGSDATGVELQSVLFKASLVYICIACYVAMVLTNWATITNENGDESRPMVGRTSMWMQVIALWIAHALYIWSMLAPRFLPGRDFS